MDSSWSPRDISDKQSKQDAPELSAFAKGVNIYLNKTISILLWTICVQTNGQKFKVNL